MNIKDIEKILDKIRPSLEQDGGNIEIVEYTEDTNELKVRFLGHCVGCPFARQTLEKGIVQTLKLHLPEIKLVTLVE